MKTNFYKLTKHPQKAAKPSSTRFKRFNGKKYSAFASIGKNVSIGVMTLCCSLLSIETHALRSSNQIGANKTLESDTVVEIPELIINADKITGINPLIQLTSVLNSELIERSSKQNLQDVINQLQSVDVRKRGEENVQADVSIRGSTSDQSLILLNGINFSDPQTGHYSLNIPINFNNIERIELLQGCGVWAYTAMPFSGALNIVTKKYHKPEAEIKFTGGSYGYYQAEAYGGFNKNKWSSNANFSYTSSDGYTDNTDFKILNAFAETNFMDSKKIGSFNFQVGYQQKDYGANSFYSTKYRNQFDATKALITSLKYNKQWSIYSIESSIYYRKHNERFELFRDFTDAPDFYKGHNYHTTDVAGTQTTFAIDWIGGKSSIGVNYRYEHIFSNVLGEDLPAPLDSNSLYKKAAQRHNTSIYLQHFWENKHWKAGGGIMVFSNNKYGTKALAGLSIGYNYKAFTVEASMNQAYRMPTFTDLYYNSPSQIGNPDLKPEQSINSELSFAYNKNPFSFRAGIFHRYAFSVIDWVRRPEEELWFSKNLTKLNTIGAETEFKFTPNIEYLHFISLNYTFINVWKNSDQYISLYATDYLKHQFSLSIAHKIYSNLDAYWFITARDRAGTYIDAFNYAEPKEVAYKPYFLCDFKLSWSRPQYEVFVTLNNIFNVKYVDIGNLPQQGFSFKVGGSIKFGHNQWKRK